MAPRLLPRWRLPSSMSTSAPTASSSTWQPHPWTPSPWPHTCQTQTRGVKYGWSTAPKRGSRPERFNARTPGLPPPTTGPAAAMARKAATTPVRTGILATKRGMTAFYSRRGTRIPCTVLELEDVQVVATKTAPTHGYWAVQVGLADRRAATVAAPQLGYYEAKGIAPKAHLAEFRVRDAGGLLTPGLPLLPDWFHIGQWVDVRSQSRGFGFAGGMKRHGFSGQNKTHGNSRNHRTMGTTGPSQGSGSRVMPGKKMPGRMGNERVTVQNLSVLQVDNALGIIVVKGAVGGPKGALVRLSDAIKKPPPPPAFVAAARALAELRAPDAAAHLDAARVRHLALKQARRDGSIDLLMARGLSALSVAEPAETAAEPTPPPASS